MFNGLQYALVQQYMALLNNNNYGINFIVGFLIQTDIRPDKFTFQTNPIYYETVTTKYVPVMLDFSTKSKNIEGQDMYSWTATFSFLLSGDSESDQQLINEKNAIEEFRRYISSNPSVSVNVNDTAYQEYSQNRTGKVAIAWETETEYTILANIAEYSSDLGFTVVNNTQADIPGDIVIGADTEGVFKQKFTTGLNPEDNHRQFLSGGGNAQTVTIRTAILKGDFTSLSDEVIKNIVEAKDLSGTYTNLLNNKFDFAEWTKEEITNFKVVNTIDNYNIIQSATHMSIESRAIDTDATTWLPITMSIALESGLNISYGNEWIVKLGLKGGTRYDIKHFGFTPLKGKTTESNSDLTSSNPNTKTIAIDGTPRIDLSFYYDKTIPVHNEIYKELIKTDETTVNKEYDIEITNGVISETKTVILVGISSPNPRGNLSQLNIQLGDV